jgi:hypothetical protein
MFIVEIVFFIGQKTDHVSLAYQDTVFREFGLKIRKKLAPVMPGNPGIDNLLELFKLYRFLYCSGNIFTTLLKILLIKSPCGDYHHRDFDNLRDLTG